MKPRKFFTAMCFLCAAAIPTPPHAQDYPSRLIQFIVPATPGTVMDTMARVLGPKMSQRWGVPIMVDNKIGAGGIVGAHAVAKANPDGHTFLFVGSSFETLAASHPKLPYDPIKSFGAWSSAATFPPIPCGSSSTRSKGGPASSISARPA
ncbi:MAG: hypothetical protein HYU75_10895 [Betaproteobacteria bacterium]|nr:hypothetical protein [Betaproteobacteria bacterium]